MMRQTHADRRADKTQITANRKLHATLPVFQRTASVLSNPKFAPVVAAEIANFGFGTLD